ncbi:MAG: hypothetical protein WHV44_15075 [Anaerolineales bacterium]
MMKMNQVDRMLILGMVLLAGYQVAVGIDGLGTAPILAYTVAFGALVVAGLLMLILGLEVLESPAVVIVATIIPLALAIGLVWQHLAGWRLPFLTFFAVGFGLVVATRVLPMPGKLPVVVIALVHGVAGLVIFLLPSVLAADGSMRPAFALVGLGGAMMGLGGLLLSFLRMGQPIVSRAVILRLLPALLFLMTLAFVAGFALG